MYSFNAGDLGLLSLVDPVRSAERRHTYVCCTATAERLFRSQPPQPLGAGPDSNFNTLCALDTLMFFNTHFGLAKVTVHTAVGNKLAPQ